MVAAAVANATRSKPKPGQSGETIITSKLVLVIRMGTAIQIIALGDSAARFAGRIGDPV